jgi:hypothetical protein
MAHHRAFMRLSFRDKLLEIERMAEAARTFEEGRRELGLPVREQGPKERGPQDR